MKQSGLLKRQILDRQVFMDAAVRIEKQFLLDTLQMTLHEFGWGYKRIKELTDRWGEVYDLYHTALEAKTESDVWQEKMDRAIQDIIKGQQEFLPFSKRYEDIRRIGYDKPMRGVEPIKYGGK